MTAPYFIGIVAASLFVSVDPPGETTLRWKFATGQVLEFERSAVQKQTVTLKGKKFTQERSSDWHIRLEAKGKQNDRFQVLATLIKVEHKVVGAADDELLDPKLHEKMQGSTFRLEVAPDGRIVIMQGYDDFLKRLGGGDPSRAKALRVMFSEASVRESLADLFGPLPSTSVAKGAAWQGEFIEPIPHFGRIRATVKYAYEGAEAGRERIEYTIQTKYEQPAKDEKAILRVVKGSIESDKAAGFIVFDNAAGRLLEHERTLNLRGNLTVETLERRHPLEFSSESQVKIRIRK